jgi:DNA-binding PadR family transcriptional regulator
MQIVAHTEAVHYYNGCKYIEMCYSGPMDDPGRFLPLPQAMFHILVALAEDDLHGYAIMLDVAARTNGKLKLSPGTLYGSIKKMLEDGFIQEIGPKLGASNDDERRRYYRLTRFGRQVAAAEAERLTALLAQARANGLIPKRS